MQRAVTAVQTDEDGQQVALLDCGHTHRSPPRGASAPAHAPAMSGTALLQRGIQVDCAACDRAEWPRKAAEYKSTPWFTEDSVPKGLLANHRTRQGTWGRIEVAEGTLRYIAEPPVSLDCVLAPDSPGVVVPQHPHRVETLGPVRFRVVFFRVASK